MVNFPGGFPWQPPSNRPGSQPGFPGPPGGSSPQPQRPRPNFPGGGSIFPGGGPNIPGGPGQQSGNPAPPPPQVISQFNYLQQNPTEANRMLQQQSNARSFAAGCNGRWTIIQLWNGQLFLMFVFSTNFLGNTTGIIWPNFTFGSFPSSQIAFYQCF